MSGYDLVKSQQLYDLAWNEDSDEAAALRLIADPTVDVNFSPADADGRTPLRQSAWFGRINIVEALLKRPEIRVNEARQDGSTPLYVAAQNGHDKVVKLLLNHPGIMINQLLEDGTSSVWIAAHKGHEKVIKLLLAMTKDLNVMVKPHPGPQPWRLRTANEQALAMNHVEIFALLMLYEPSDDHVETKVRQARIRKDLRKELKFNVEDAAQLLALLVLLSDDYLKLKQDAWCQNTIRFYQINLQLPLELQTRICNLAFEHDSILIPSKSFEAGLKAATRLF